MKKLIAFIALLTLTASVHATSAFCLGFEQGFKSIKGSMAMVPMCPMEPMTPMGKTPFQMGIIAGIRAAQ